MEKFDPYSESIQEKVNVLIDKANKELQSGKSDISNNIKRVKVT